MGRFAALGITALLAALIGSCSDDGQRQPVAAVETVEAAPRQQFTPPVQQQSTERPSEKPAPQFDPKLSEPADDLDEKMAEYEAANAEYHAAEKLRLARQLGFLAAKANSNGDVENANRLTRSVAAWHRSIIRFYPETAAARDCEKLLDGVEVAERPMPPRPQPPPGVKTFVGDLVDKVVREAAGEKPQPKRKKKPSVEADDGGYYSGPVGYVRSGGAKTVHVRSYTRKDGTVVRAHTRSAPGRGGGRRR